jgi:hypothetical protein
MDDVTALLARAYGPAADDDAADRAFGLDPTAPAVRRRSSSTRKTRSDVRRHRPRARPDPGRARALGLPRLRAVHAVSAATCVSCGAAYGTGHYSWCQFKTLALRLARRFR